MRSSGFGPGHRDLRRILAIRQFDPREHQGRSGPEADKYQGARVMLNGELAKAIIRVQVDIGFGDHVYPAPKLASFPSILPNLPTASILMYPPETVVAEKFEAMIRFGLANGRIKDFYDIWLTTQIFAVSALDCDRCGRRHIGAPRNSRPNCEARGIFAGLRYHRCGKRFVKRFSRAQPANAGTSRLS